jgi:A/G-specific adenine glycosylase
LAASGGHFPAERADVEALPGVGQYVANAICLFALHQPEPLLDVNMARVLERNFGRRKLADIRYDPRLQEVSRLVVSGPDSVQVNWAILDLASGVCTTVDPQCWQCPLFSVCDYAQDKKRRVHCLD